MKAGVVPIYHHSQETLIAFHMRNWFFSFLKLISAGLEVLISKGEIPPPGDNAKILLNYKL